MRCLLVVLCFILSGCASTGEVWERVDGELKLVKYWEIKGAQSAQFSKEQFSVDNKQTPPLQDMININALKTE